MIRGDIVVADLGGDRRPVVVLTRDSVLPFLSRVTIAPITRTQRGLATEVPLDVTDGMRTACVISCDNVTTISRSHIYARITSLGPERLRELNDALRTALALDA